MEDDNQNKIMIIINGKAGSGIAIPRFVQWMLRIPIKKNISKEKRRQLIEDGFSELNANYKIFETTHAGHASELTREAIEDGYNIVTAVGGDGTINEVVNALTGSNVALGIIPAGTANLLASELKIPTDIKKACKIICQGTQKQIDTLQINEHIYTVTASAGFDAHVVKEVDDENAKSIWGALSYVLIAFREIYRYPHHRIKIRTEEGKVMSVYALFIQNARTYATGYPLSPKSKLDDGVFEVLIIPTRNLFKLISYNTSKTKRSHYMELNNVKALEIKSHHAIQTDGDFICKGPAKIKINPKSLNVIIPKA